LQQWYHLNHGEILEGTYEYLHCSFMKLRVRQDLRKKLLIPLLFEQYNLCWQILCAGSRKEISIEFDRIMTGFRMQESSFHILKIWNPSYCDRRNNLLCPIPTIR
jgi:hypothetical protein